MVGGTSLGQDASKQLFARAHMADVWGCRSSTESRWRFLPTATELLLLHGTVGKRTTITQPVYRAS
eukprot:6388325-Amphidinium_carterae.2